MKKTVATLATLLLVGVLHAQSAEFGRATNGTQLYVYSDGPAWSRMALRYKLKPAGGAWSAEQTFYDAGTHNSYPTLIEAAPGNSVRFGTAAPRTGSVRTFASAKSVCPPAQSEE